MKARCLAHCLAMSLTAAASAQSTAFTYQGRLTSGGNPASGPHDMQLRLFDAASGGAQVGSTLCFDNVQVAAGLFSLQLDFGQQFASPTARFLEIQVRPEIGQPCADQFAYVTLAPRQALTATPLANHAKSAFTLDAADGSPANAVFVANDGKVGIGTLAPTHTVHIATAQPTIALQDTNAASQQAGYVSYRDNSNVERAWIGYGTAGSPDFSIINARPGGDIVLTPLNGDNVILVGSGGNVGIGTASPVNRLTVVGTTDFAGNVGIGTAFPAAKLEVAGAAPNNIGIRSTATGTAIHGDGVSNSSCTGVLGEAGFTAATSVTGVHGRVFSGDVNAFGVFATGRSGASGTKSFRIDHPDDPANAYLFHYSVESPEVINFYRGTVRLDGNGTAVVSLPPYFAKINANPSYQLTAVGAPMPMLHIAARISDRALDTGAALAPGVAAELCWFSIAGGEPGGEVCWRVEAQRNDAFVRANGAPVEVAKPAHERGTYQHPGLYGQPESRRVDSHVGVGRSVHPADAR